MSETKINQDHHSKMEYFCPYCGAEYKIENVENFKFVAAHPPIIKCSKEFSEHKNHWFRFWEMKRPERVMEKLERCKDCTHDFYVCLSPYNSDSDDVRDFEDFNYHLKLHKGETKIIERKLLLEDILDRFCNILHVKYPIGCFLFILMPWILFCMLPAIALGGFSKISHDYGFLFLFVLFVSALIFLKRNCEVLRKMLDYKELPLLLSDRYKLSNLIKSAEESGKGWIFGHPFQRIISPTFLGLVAVALFLLWQIHYTVNIASTFYETPYIGQPITYTSYVLAVLAIPFWAMIYFIIGNITWIFISTVALIGLMAKHMPLAINPLKDMGGTEVFGEILRSSLYPFAILGAGIPVAVVWSCSQDSYVLLICTFFVLLFTFLLAFGFFYPLWHIHKELTKTKKREQDDILSQISLPTMKVIDSESTAHAHLLLDTHTKISSMHEWPFKIDTLIKVCSAILLPIISLLITIVI